MRRLACLLMAVGCVLLALTVVGASRPERAPARVVRAVGAAHVAAGLRRAMDRFMQGLGGPGAIVGPRVIGGRRRPRPSQTITVPGAPGQTCAIAGGSCSLHPCRLYTGASRSAVLPLTTVVRARVRRPGRALSSTAIGPPGRRCRPARPDFVAARLTG
ncbi:MAG TPA: hypothetical protein VFN55_03505 [Solirubrobacteraceae bacterium]|nr:hypothetical protein [Solirubrobacteraceae bacterium]